MSSRAPTRTDLVAAVPRSLYATHARRYRLACSEPPLGLRKDAIQAVLPQAALMDPALAWLYDAIGRAARASAR